MKDTIYLIANNKKVERMTKTLPDVRKSEIVIKVDVNVKESVFNTATIPQEIFINDWRDNIDLEDVEFNKNIISKEEAELIKQKRLDKMERILIAQGYKVEKIGEED